MPTNNENFIYFKSYNEYFKILNVEVIKTLIVPSITKVAGANSVISGIINFEGIIIPLLNFSKIKISSQKKLKAIVVNSDNWIFSVCGELIPFINDDIDFKVIDYTQFFSNEK